MILLYGGLNHMMFLHLRFWDDVDLGVLSLSVSSYWVAFGFTAASKERSST